MIEDLFDLARGRMGHGMQVSFEPIADLESSIEDVVNELRGIYPERDIITALNITRCVVGDKGRLQQLVSNLVGNALTHGSSETEVSVTARTSSQHLEIIVRNAGMPIPHDSIAGIFDAYTRLESSGTTKTGLGLGLYICEQIVTAHGGTLSVQSTEEDGTVFTARIPDGARFR